MSLYEEFDDACSILVPVDIINTPGALVSMTAGGVELPEDTNPAYSSSATYKTGDRVYVLSTHRIYESARDANTGRDPTAVGNQYDAAGAITWWIDTEESTNRSAAFDGLVATQTLATSPLVITLDPGAANGFTLLGVDADSLSVEWRDSAGGAVIYSETNTPLEGSMPGDYYEYFFDRFKPLRQVIRTGIDPYGSARVKITLNRASGKVGLGLLAIGDLRPTGVPLKGVSVEPTTFSSITQNKYGRPKIIRRPNSTGMTISTVMDEEDANSVLQTVKDVLDVPCVVIGSSAMLYEWMTVFGTISGSMSDQPYPYVTLKLTVRGFI